MSIKNFTLVLIFIFSNTFVFADDVQLKLKFIEKGPLGSDVILRLKNTGTSNIFFRQFKRDVYRVYLALVVDPTGNLVRRKSWKKVEPIRIPTKPGYNSRNAKYLSESFIRLEQNSSNEIYSMLLSLVNIPSFQQYYVMFLLRDKTRFYKTNILSFEKTGERRMKQYDISKSGVPETVLTAFSNEIKLLYQEEGLQPD